MKIIPIDDSQLDELAAIEARDGDVHWSRVQFEKELASDVLRFFAAQEEDSVDILAYGGYRKAGPEAQITNLVVGKESRCRGIAKRLVEFILDCARGEMCTDCTLEVRKSNAHAQSLYSHLGFKIQGTRPNMYTNPVEDAILMEKTL